MATAMVTNRWQVESLEERCNMSILSLICDNMCKTLQVFQRVLGKKSLHKTTPLGSCGYCLKLHQFFSIFYLATFGTARLNYVYLCNARVLKFWIKNSEFKKQKL